MVLKATEYVVKYYYNMLNMRYKLYNYKINFGAYLMNFEKLSFLEIHHFDNNIEAIKCLKKHEANGTLPTENELEILKGYIGWGSLAKVFPDSENCFVSEKWATRNSLLRELLADIEYTAAQASITDSFYTPDVIISSMWEIIKRLGQDQGVVLEPSCGTGKFIYKCPSPENMRFIGVENDPISARIAKLINNTGSYIFETGFENLPLQQGCFDLIIGNPPYGDFGINLTDFLEYNRFSIHNQFILKSLQSLKHKKYAVFVVSRYVLDSSDAQARKEISFLADLVSAFRLPSGAFKDGTTSNTEVITDILVFKRKCLNDENFARSKYGTDGVSFPVWVNADVIDDQNGKNLFLNRFFSKNPENLAGQVEFKSGPFGRELFIAPTANLEVSLKNWVDFTFKVNQDAEVPNLVEIQTEFDALVAHLYIEMSGKEIGVIDKTETGELYRIIEQDVDSGFRYKTQILGVDTVWSDKYVFHVSGNYYSKIPKLDELGNKVFEVNDQGYSNGRIVYEKQFIEIDEIGVRSKLGKTRMKKLELLVDLRECLNQQLKLESNDCSIDEIESNRIILNTKYDNFLKKFGYINASSTLSLINDLPDAGLLLALEDDYKKPVKEFVGYLPTGKQNYRTVQDENAAKAAIFRQRVIFKQIRPNKAVDCAHALSLSLSYKGGVDIKYMADLLDMDNQQVIDQLYTNTPTPQIFFDHQIYEWVHKSVYLSGNVRKKLKYAQSNGDAIAEQALLAVQPEYIHLENISISLGMTWLPVSLYESFIRYISDDPNAKIFYERVSNVYDLVCTPSAAKSALYSTDNLSLLKLLEHLFNNVTIRIVRNDYCTIKKCDVKVFDAEATELAISLAETMKQEFISWLYSQTHLLENLEEIYNQTFNSYVVPKFEGSNIILEGKVPDSIIEFRQHQLNAIYRGVLSQFTLYDHTVGAGKSFISIARAMLRKQLGLTKKSLIIVPNHLVIQFAADVYRLFPSAKVLAATPNDFAKKNRKRLFCRIATGDYDVVIMAHSSFEFIKLSDSIQDKFIQDEIDTVENALLEIEANSGQRRTAKALVTLKKRLEKKLSNGLNLKREDKLITFDLLGVNNIEVDEFHSYKNLQYYSNLNNVVGMGNPSGSYRAFDMYIKFLYLHSINGSAGCYTGTPVSNSAVEIYNIKRFLIPNILKELNLDHFDNWARLYADNVTKFEATESGKLKQVTRFAREWRNLSSMMGLWFQFSDSISKEDLNRIHRETTGKDFPVPRVSNGGRQTHVVKPTIEQKEILDQILQRYEKLENISDLKDRNSERLRLMDLARKLSLSARCVDPVKYCGETGGKISALANNVFSIYNELNHLKGTQLIFLDRSVPKSNSDVKLIKQYDSLIGRLNKAIEEQNETAIQILEDRLECFNVHEIEAIRLAQDSNWSAYQEIKNNLISLGIPSNQIKFIQEAKTDQEKQEIFDLVNSGEIRVLVGSTAKMGCGTNVQKRLVHLHHADITFKPSDIEQREGRILRQGNLLFELLGDMFEVGISCYVTEHSSDARMWELNSIKLKMIGIFRNYNGQHTIDFGAEADAISMKEIAALATGNPLMLERVELEAEIQKIERLKANYSRQQANFVLQVSKSEKALNTLPSKRESYLESALNYYAPLYEEAILRAEQLNISINDQIFTNYGNALEFLLKLKEQQAKIYIDAIPCSYSRAKTMVKECLKDKDKPFHYVSPTGEVFRNSIEAAEVIYKIITAYDSDELGCLFGLPLHRQNSMNCHLVVTTVDEECEISRLAIKKHEITVINVASMLITLSKRIGIEFNEVECKISTELKNANEIISQIKPKIGLVFDKETEFQYKKLRLNLIQIALSDVDPEAKFEELLLENAIEISSLTSKLKNENTGRNNNATLHVETNFYNDSKSLYDETSTKRGPTKKNKCKMLVGGKIKLALQLELF